MVNWQDEQVFWEASEFFFHLIDDVNSAKSSVVLETFIFDFDAVGHRVVNALVAAAKRGVNVRVLVDGIGSYESSATLVDYLTAGGVDVRIYHPVPWDFSVYKWARISSIKYLKLPYFMSQINKRDHRKLCLVDNSVAWVGSFNMSSKHLGEGALGSVQEREGWNDLAARVCGDAVVDLCQDFENIWYRRKQGGVLSRARLYFTNRSLALRREKIKNLISFIDKAEQSICIANAYFSPPRSLMKALVSASRRGVSIRVLVPGKSDVIFFPSLSRTYYADLLRSGLRIFEYRKKILHAKYWIIDDLVIVGSTNLNYRSVLHDLELDVLLRSPKSLQSLEGHFQADLRASVEITPQNLRAFSGVFPVFGWLSRFLRYWM